MVKSLKYIIMAAFAGLLVFSCAKEENESNASVQKRILKAWLEVNYPNKNYTVTKSGLVILDKQDGDGLSPENEQAAYLKYSVKDLGGNYQSTMFKSVAETLGTYSQANYYGPQLSTLGYGDITEGMNEALQMMSKGAKMTIIIPPALSKYDNPENYDNGYGYGYSTEKTESASTNLIYEIEMFDVVSNLQRYQLDSLQSFRDIYYPGLDSTANMFYFKKLEGTATDTIEDGKTANVWYVGRLLDGYVFDTNIEDTAKKYGLYTSGGSYEALSVTYEEKYEDMASGVGTINVAGSSSSSSSDDEGGSYVPGFAKALKCMKFGDHAITFFGSGWGYGSTGTISNGAGIPSYSMLFFELYVEEPED